jgi:hypothetical protein
LTVGFFVGFPVEALREVSSAEQRFRAHVACAGTCEAPLDERRERATCKCRVPVEDGRFKGAIVGRRGDGSVDEIS